MNYDLIKESISLVQKFEEESSTKSAETNHFNNFKKWIFDNFQQETKEISEPDWEGKEKGRSPESVINTLIIQLNRYAKSYLKSALQSSDFSSQEDFIYLNTLKNFGGMSKMDLIKKNVHEKPAGIQIINRLIRQKWIIQTESPSDKRSKQLDVTPEGLKALENQMEKIRKASTIVTGNLTYKEKMSLIILLSKLSDFHHEIYQMNLDTSALLPVAYQKTIN